PNWLNIDMLKGHGIAFTENRPTRSKIFHGRRVIEHLYQSLNGRGLRSLLRHGDRNSMRFSIESRIPFLTTDFVELLYSLPESFLISPVGETKSIFKIAMRNIVPDEILHRKDKIGFQTPQTELLLANIHTIRELLLDWANNDPIINSNKFIHTLNSILNNKDLQQLWRWMNFAIWKNRVFSQWI
ncbi:hypothetical protein TI03_05140, partial [Achromatium sp. WMS1]